MIIIKLKVPALFPHKNEKNIHVAKKITEENLNWLVIYKFVNAKQKSIRPILCINGP